MSTGTLAGPHALVTGGGSGLGADVALAMAAEGALVTIMGRRPEALAEIVDQAQGRGLAGSIVAAPGDVTSEAAVDAVVADAEARAPLSMLVTAAGINAPGPTIDVPMETVDRILDTNVRGTYLAARAVGRVLLEAGREGRIVLMSSQMGEVGFPGRAAYCASKHAVNGLMKALAVEWAPHGITVNAVAPTFVLTPLTAPMFDDPAFKADVLGRIPAGRLAEIGHVTAAVQYFLTEAAAMTTGQCLAVDGGWTAW